MLRLTLAAALVTGFCHAQPAPLLEIAAEELNRNFQILKEKGDPSPYFLQYGIVEMESESYGANLGALQVSTRNRSRVVDVDVRVGSHKLDNYHSTRGERPQFSGAVALPIEDNPDEIRRRLWLETDRTWRSAAQRFINLKTSIQVNVAASDSSDDFSREEPSAHAAPVKPLNTGGAGLWEERARKWSAAFAKHPGILAGGVGISFLRETRYVVNSEGTRVQHGRIFARITMTARGKASDGMDLVTTGSFEAADPSGLPDDGKVQAEVERVASELVALLQAPQVDPFVGPAILSGRAAAVFFHEIFGHRVEGHRQKDDSEGQTFTKMVNTPVLPDFLSVIFDPTRKQAAGTDLNGTYLYDDEGVKARPVTVVDKGVLKTFLLSRSPIENFPTSNGHGRKQPGREVVSRQSNLLVESSKQVPDAQLREMLIAEIKRQEKPYGFLFQQVTGGYTTTGRRGLQAYTVMPLIVYRIYPDGRPDELVRGVDIVGTPLASFSRILATSSTPEVFNGYCGAESGSVPVSAVAPALLVSEIEIQKKDKGTDRPPILDAPSDGGGL